MYARPAETIEITGTVEWCLSIPFLLFLILTITHPQFMIATYVPKIRRRAAIIICIKFIYLLDRTRRMSCRSLFAVCSIQIVRPCRSCRTIWIVSQPVLALSVLFLAFGLVALS